MDCLRSVIVSINQELTYSTSPFVKNWTIGTENYWVIKQTGGSTLNFEGFSNIDVYGIDVVGGIQTWAGAAVGGVLVTDWNFEFFVNGTLSLGSDYITASPNFWAIQTQTNNTKLFALSKNTNSLKFASPILSVKSIAFECLNAQGTGQQTALTASLDIDLSFIVYYKFQGE
jgi:hypothetical protein